jgi:hypothetical protein
MLIAESAVTPESILGHTYKLTERHVPSDDDLCHSILLVKRESSTKYGCRKG